MCIIQYSAGHLIFYFLHINTLLPTDYIELYNFSTCPIVGEEGLENHTTCIKMKPQLNDAHENITSSLCWWRSLFWQIAYLSPNRIIWLAVNQSNFPPSLLSSLRVHVFRKEDQLIIVASWRWVKSSWRSTASHWEDVSTKRQHE